MQRRVRFSLKCYFCRCASSLPTPDLLLHADWSRCQGLQFLAVLLHHCPAGSPLPGQALPCTTMVQETRPGGLQGLCGLRLWQISLWVQAGLAEESCSTNKTCHHISLALQSNRDTNHFLGLRQAWRITKIPMTIPNAILEVPNGATLTVIIIHISCLSISESMLGEISRFTHGTEKFATSTKWLQS